MDHLLSYLDHLLSSDGVLPPDLCADFKRGLSFFFDTHMDTEEKPPFVLVVQFRPAATAFVIFLF